MLSDQDSWQQLADNLMHMPASEAIYLLTTFANMACGRSYEEEDFIHLVTLEVFEVILWFFCLSFVPLVILLQYMYCKYKLNF